MDIFTLFFLIILVFSIILHEVAHGYAAEALGDPTARLAGRLTLNPLPHIDIFGSLILPALLVFTHAPFLFGWAKPVPYNPYNLRKGHVGEALVAGAGPATNILIALVFGLLIRFGSLSETFVAFASIAVFTNIVLAVFNLIPIPPLDGSKLIRIFLPVKVDLWFMRAEERIMRFGIFGFLIGIWLVVALVSPLLGACSRFLFHLITGISW
jgi:Zn-dependent protease